MPVNATDIRHANIVIASNSDFTVRVVEQVQPRVGVKQRHITDFKVSKEKLIAKSEYFRGMLRYSKSDKTTAELEGDTRVSMELWLRVLHEDALGHLHEMPRMEIWHVIRAGDKYIFNFEDLRPWFDEWYDRNVEEQELDSEIARELAFPCWIFDHAVGFAHVTKWLVYNFPGHITERNPIGPKYRHIHLAPPDFVGLVNQARGRLKTVLRGPLWEKVGSLLSEPHTCSCWQKTSAEYLAALVKCKVYPLEESFPKNSVTQIFHRLEGFGHTSAAKDCKPCNVNWPECVSSARKIARGYFDGLCLDCMDHSKPKRADEDEDYWTHDFEPSARWDQNCRINHGEPTWYHSWLGRDDRRQKLLKERHKALSFNPSRLY